VRLIAIAFLGFTAFGVGAGEILAPSRLPMIAGLPYTALRDAVLTHPTLVEGLIPRSQFRGVSAQRLSRQRSPRSRPHGVKCNSQ